MIASRISVSSMNLTTNEILFSFCLNIARQFCKSSEARYHLDDKTLLSCTIVAHQGMIQEGLERWDAGSPCCSGCLLEDVFRLSKQSKNDTVEILHAKTRRVLEKMLEEQTIQLAITDLARFEQNFSSYKETDVDTGSSAYI